jgi:transcriptional regulator with XRE-family HTH domain
VAHQTKKKAVFRNALGLQIRKMREGRGWSQADFARQLQLAGWDIERSIVTKIELRRRCITDYELLIMMKTLGSGLAALAPAKESELRVLLTHG